MPEMHFRVRWPDGAEEECYSPSLVIKDFFSPGQSYPLSDFVARGREALMIASDRVKARYGMPCSLALGQLDRLGRKAASFSTMPDAAVLLMTFSE